MNSSPEPEAAPEPSDSFDSIYSSWLEFVWLLLRRLGVREADLDDAAQDVFIVVHRRLADYDRSRPIRAWLGGIAHHVAMRERRRPRHARETYPEPGALTEMTRSESSPERELADAQRRTRLMIALETLDDDRRAVFAMHDLQEMSGPEVAEALGVPLNTVYTRLRAARTEVRATFSRLRLAGGET